MEFEWNISQDSPHRVQEFLSKMSVEPEDFTGRIIFMSMFNDISWRPEDNEQECELVSIYAKRFSTRRCSFLGPGSEKKWYSTHESKPQGEWERVAELMMIKIWRKRTPSFPIHESSVPRRKIINTLLR